MGIESAEINIFHSYQQANSDMAVKFMSDLIDQQHAAERSLIMQSGTRVINAIHKCKWLAVVAGRTKAVAGVATKAAAVADAVAAIHVVHSQNNHIDITDPHRNFSSGEWEQLWTVQFYALQLQEGGILIFANELKVTTIIELGMLYKFKLESVKKPNIYLRVNMEKAQLPNGKVEWAMGSSGNVLKNSVKVGETLIAEDNPEAKLKTTARNPFPSGYKPI